jgi:hypothetical protein
MVVLSLAAFVVVILLFGFRTKIFQSAFLNVFFRVGAINRICSNIFG